MKIAIIGYGKMGHMIEEVALSRGHQIVGVIDPRLNEELKIKNEELSLPLIDFESEEFRSADVAIEFTTPATAEDNIRKAWEQGVPVVCGTTGWDAAALMDEDRRTHDKQMLVWSSNYSVGVNIFFELNKFLAEKIREASPQPSPEGKGGYTPSIKEIHHIHKLDKPSGTAKTLAEQISAMYEGRMYDVRREVPIESIREGEVPGTHEVTWDSEEDTIVITHIAKGRRGFALGAVLAAEEVTR